ncbi:thiol-disulfide isomerase/thioredoxin [Haloferula luteola]|uniref:Thiol-disulfide isomerase/thioredoxin n=1 Tax=Haloferula luteola TaxID=595692 RepID=A0A840VCW1_9BACT|nr:TlpA disulfide reductase family protein [Haloferula luteola]MBB5352468.1 thiol-disulfide isomerase/thioredoxin [Haloferula luteola]
MKTFLISILSAAAGVGILFAEDEATPQGSLSQVNFGELVNGVKFEKSDLEGKVVVVEKWGTQCGPCLAFLPELAKIAKRYEKKGLAVIGMEVQQSQKDAINKILDKSKVKYPVVAGGATPVNEGYIPHAQIFGVDGQLLWAGNPHDDEFLRTIKKGLKDVGESTLVAEEEDEVEGAPLMATREWTNLEGKTIRAEVVRVEEEKVIFRMNGREVPYDLDQLVEADREAIREAADVE